MLRVSSVEAVLNEVGNHEKWLERGYGGDMHYLYRDPAKRYDPRHLLPECRSVIVLAASYYHHNADYAEHGEGRVARYAWGDNYHNVLTPRLKQLGRWLDGMLDGHSWRVTVDSSPLAEKAFAVAAGIGMRGRNSLVVNREIGSYFFLGCILSSAELPVDDPVDYSCGTCTRCVTACPQDALTGPGILKADRCISYLTTECKDEVDGSVDLQEWLFGCDTCQQVCPFNYSPLQSIIHRFAPRKEIREARASRIVSMKDEEFRTTFEGSVFIRRKFHRVQAQARAIMEQAGRCRMNAGEPE
ncbi:MAG: tRNA epoxyqueuosine(34) reductase QueG [Planctomycetales bacterium]|nr:tRNA epoxyqueuosine(34) reductase QueG [bacterium]UNM07744.1 MAG: tRNA epoxyqueuosine(34) reductase QueG [Planctomycetales bacterium]